jgi:hypothetical protein
MKFLCDKTSTDQKDHVGPFAVIWNEVKPEGLAMAASCKACGNLVLRDLKPGEPLQPVDHEKWLSEF